MHPAWSANGGELTVAQGSGATFRGRTLTHNPWWDVIRVPADGGDPTQVVRVALPTGSGPERVQRRAILAPSWGPEDRIFFPEIIDGGTTVVSMRRDGEDRQIHLILPSADEVAVSPDGRWIVYETRIVGQFDLWLIDPAGEIKEVAQWVRDKTPRKPCHGWEKWKKKTK